MAAVLYEKKGKTAYVVINRPEKRNAINYEVRKGLLEAWQKVNDDPDVYSVIMTGGDKIFSAGQDLEEVLNYRQQGREEDLPLLEETYNTYIKKPVIAAINGYCLGAGFLLALKSDIRIASDDAKFGVPEVKLGITPTLGLTVRMAQYLPSAIALELLLLGESLSAEHAYRLGFINKVVPQNEVMPTAEAYADRINQLSPLATQNIKQQYYMGISLSPQVIALSDSIAKLARYSEDYGEGLRAFTEKRKPEWKGK